MTSNSTGHLTVSPLANDPFTLSPPLERPLGTAVLLQWMKDHDSQIRFQSRSVNSPLIHPVAHVPVVAPATSNISRLFAVDYCEG